MSAQRIWKNSAGVAVDLSKEKRFSIGETAREMGKSVSWVQRKIRARELLPVIHHNPRSIEVYACAIGDYYARHTALPS